MKYDIYISDKDKKTVLQLPIIPEQMPSLNKASKNEEFETFNNGTFNIIGDVGLMEFTLESWLPAKGRNYSFQRVKNINPDAYISLINKAMATEKPIKIVIVRGNGTFVCNDTFSVENFEYNENKIGNFEYSLGVKQWRDYNV